MHDPFLPGRGFNGIKNDQVQYSMIPIQTILRPTLNFCSKQSLCVSDVLICEYSRTVLGTLY